MTESELILAAVMRWYPPRLFAVCDRVSWGFGLPYEADAVAISNFGLCDELEAKSTAADLRTDLAKRKWRGEGTHGWNHIFCDRFWYVVPEELRDDAIRQASPRGFGVVVVLSPHDGRLLGKAVRVLKAKILRADDKSRREKLLQRRAELWRLAGLRYWDELGTRLQNGKS